MVRRKSLQDACGAMGHTHTARSRSPRGSEPWNRLYGWMGSTRTMRCTTRQASIGATSTKTSTSAPTTHTTGRSIRAPRHQRAGHAGGAAAHALVFQEGHATSSVKNSTTSGPRPTFEAQGVSARDAQCTPQTAGSTQRPPASGNEVDAEALHPMLEATAPRCSSSGAHSPHDARAGGARKGSPASTMTPRDGHHGEEQRRSPRRTFCHRRREV
ncbi:hypothetical protein GGX14DRAFT_466279, partial [Mycena pura]